MTWKIDLLPPQQRNFCVIGRWEDNKETRDTRGNFSKDVDITRTEINAEEHDASTGNNLKAVKIICS